MRYLVLADIHGNSDALDAVLEEALDESIDSVIVLGDLVGYGAGPNEVIHRLLGFTKPMILVRGNHDKVVATQLRDSHFNAVARQAAQWTAQELTSENLEYLANLPCGPLEVAPGSFVCHGSPLDEDEYLLNLEDASNVFLNHPGDLIFFGHTHIPACFSASKDRLTSLILDGSHTIIRLEVGRRYLANPGSVGQPRDRDPRAAYFVYDSENRAIDWRRCDYSIRSAQRRILEAGLPEVLAHRLAVGL